jgi:hypothetical protein
MTKIDWRDPRIDKPVCENNYLVVWKRYGESYSNVHRAYWSRDEERFFSAENESAFPLDVDFYTEMPEL